MARGRKNIRFTQKSHASPSARMLAVSKGVTTADEFAQFMSALMSDVIGGRVTPQVANAACNAGGKLLKVVDMQYRLGREANGHRHLELTAKT